jgi:hypothetical protein
MIRRLREIRGMLAAGFTCAERTAFRAAYGRDADSLTAADVALIARYFDALRGPVAASMLATARSHLELLEMQR